MASMAGLNRPSPAALKGGLSTSVAAARPPSATIRAQQKQQQGPSVSVTAGTSRRSLLSLVATGLASVSFVPVVLADAVPIKVGPPPPPSGGLPGTLNSDEARDLNLPLKKRFFLQPLPPSEAAERLKESAKEIVNVKSFIDKKAWPYVQNDLRLKSEYLRYDLNTIVSSQPREVKKSFKEVTGKLFEDINNLDYAAKIKSTA